MSRFSYCLFLALSFSRLTTQSIFESPTFPGKIELTIIAHRNETGQYVTECNMKDSHTLFFNTAYNVIPNVSEYTRERTFTFSGIYTVTTLSTKGYEKFPGVGYYKFYPEGAYSFNDAMTICRKEDAHLAIPNSQEEIEVLKQIYERYPDLYHFAYIGFHDQDEEGEFITIFGETLNETGYSVWKEGEPNQGYGNEDCGSMFKNGKLNDIGCILDYPVPFFCEYNISSSN